MKIDFDLLTSRFRFDRPTPLTRWALQAILALNDVAAAVRWSG
jgi:hypothetical protein